MKKLRKISLVYYATLLGYLVGFILIIILGEKFFNTWIQENSGLFLTGMVVYYFSLLYLLKKIASLKHFQEWERLNQMKESKFLHKNKKILLRMLKVSIVLETILTIIIAIGVKEYITKQKLLFSGIEIVLIVWALYTIFITTVIYVLIKKRKGSKR